MKKMTTAASTIGSLHDPSAAHVRGSVSGVPMLSVSRSLALSIGVAKSHQMWTIMHKKFGMPYKSSPRASRTTNRIVGVAVHDASRARRPS